MSRYYAFIDESGNHDLSTDKLGASTYFIVLAVLVKIEDVNLLEAQVEIIRSKYFGPGEIKSSSLKEDRRLKIFDELIAVDFKYYAVAVNKSELDKDSGLGYKKSFIKFTNGLLYRHLFQNFPELSIFADAHGGSEFIESFKKYIRENHLPDLFSESSVEIADSKDQILIQLADFLVGSTAKLYENKVSEEYRNKYLNFLKAKKIRVDEWPPRYEPHQAPKPSDNEFDSIVYTTSLSAASRFLTDHPAPADDETRMQCATLRYLLFRARFPNDSESIPTDEIISHLKSFGFLEANKHALRSNIISKLRDRGVIIASSAKGYKIPSTYADIVDFADLVEGLVAPLLSRLNRAREIFELASLGKMDFLGEPRFTKLQRVLREFDSEEIQNNIP